MAWVGSVGDRLVTACEAKLVHAWRRQGDSLETLGVDALFPGAARFGSPDGVGGQGAVAGKRIAVGDNYMGSSPAIASANSIKVVDSTGAVVACGSTVAADTELTVSLASSQDAKRYVLEISGGQFAAGTCDATRSNDNAATLALAAGESVSLLGAHAPRWGTVHVTETCTVSASEAVETTAIPTDAPTTSPPRSTQRHMPCGPEPPPTTAPRSSTNSTKISAPSRGSGRLRVARRPARRRTLPRGASRRPVPGSTPGRPPRSARRASGRRRALLSRSRAGARRSRRCAARRPSRRAAPRRVVRCGAGR